jgi:hypothetical protein
LVLNAPGGVLAAEYVPFFQRGLFLEEGG